MWRNTVRRKDGSSPRNDTRPYWSAPPPVSSGCKQRLDAAATNLAKLIRYVGIVQPLKQSSAPDHIVPDQHLHELEIFDPASDQLGNREIIHLEAESRDPVGVFVVDRDQSVLPALRQHGRLSAHPLRVVTVQFVG